MIYGIKCFF